jgi:signal transduction histidine kinase
MPMEGALGTAGSTSGGAGAGPDSNVGGLAQNRRAAWPPAGEALRPPSSEELLSLMTSVHSGRTLDEMMERLFESLLCFIPYHRMELALYKNGGKSLRLRWTRTGDETSGAPAGILLPRAAAGLRPFLESKRPRLLNRLETCLPQRPADGLLRERIRSGLRSSLDGPLVAGKKPVGFLFLGSRRAEGYQPFHAETFSVVGDMLAGALEKARVYQHLAETDRLREKFLRMVVHDLKHPLSVVHGYVGLMRENKLGPVPPEQRKVHDLIIHSCARMASMLDELLDVKTESRLMDLEPQQVDPAALLRECHAANAVVAREKRMTLLLDIEDLPDRAVLDPDRIGQVIANLVSNAVKFSHAGSTIVLRGRSTRRELEISVKDQGQGIPEEELPNLFLEYGRARGVKPTGGEKSTGLGLAIVKLIVHAHGGRVWVKSAVGEGSLFAFTLPLDEK